MATSLAQKLVIENLKSTPKERVDMILEPLQVMIQLELPMHLLIHNGGLLMYLPTLILVELLMLSSVFI